MKGRYIVSQCLLVLVVVVVVRGLLYSSRNLTNWLQVVCKLLDRTGPMRAMIVLSRKWIFI